MWPDVAISSRIMLLSYRRLPHQSADWFAMTRLWGARMRRFEPPDKLHFSEQANRK